MIGHKEIDAAVDYCLQEMEMTKGVEAEIAKRMAMVFRNRDLDEEAVWSLFRAGILVVLEKMLEVNLDNPEEAADDLHSILMASFAQMFLVGHTIGKSQ